MPAIKLSPELSEDAELLFGAVREAGSLALTLFQQNVRSWNKADGSVVTQADLAVDEFLKSALHDKRPSYGWLSEETADSAARLSCRRLWIVDPIDGTRSFASGGDEWCIGAALVEDGRPILAALYRPVGQAFYCAAKHHGAFRNDLPMQPRDGISVAGASLIGTGKALKAVTGVVASATPNIPLLLRLAHVAAGQADIALSFGFKNDWDLAAGDLLVTEAGGRVSQLDGKEMIYNQPRPAQFGMVAAGKLRHSAVLAQLEAI